MDCVLIEQQIIQNAWRLSNYDYFPTEPRENETLNNENGTSNNTSNNENISDDKDQKLKWRCWIFLIPRVLKLNQYN